MKSVPIILSAVAWLALLLAPCFANSVPNFPPNFCCAVTLDEARTLADQGDASGQFRLGLMYYNGDHVPRDYVESYKWVSLAAAKWVSLASAQGFEQAKGLLGVIERGMTPDQIAEAQKRAAAWKPTPK